MILHGNSAEVLAGMKDNSIDCCITSPPYYGLRDYGVRGQIGLEKTSEEYILNLVHVFSEVRRILKPRGTCWVNLGDSYNAYNGNRGKSTSFQSGTEKALPSLTTGHGLTDQSLKPKDMIGVPWRFALAAQYEGWYLRQDIIWHKPNPMPESVKDRCTKSHEYLFLLTKSPKYWWDSEAMSEKALNTPGGRLKRAEQRSKGIDVRASRNKAEKGHSAEGRGLEGFGVPDTRNRRSVWTIPTMPTKEAHFATFPIEIPELCMNAGCPERGTVLDPFAGAGTTWLAALKSNRSFIGIELNSDYIEIALSRVRKHFPLFVDGAGGTPA